MSASDYILEPFDTDPNSILQDGIDYIRGFYPNWNPNPDQLDFLILKFFSLKAAILADMAARVQRSIYMNLGSSVFQFQPIAEAFATVAFTITAIDTAGHTLDSGTIIGLPDANGDIHQFGLTSDLVVDPGSTTGIGGAEALEAGTSSNNLTGQAVLTEEVDWITTVVASVVSSGGADPESVQDYLNRLSLNFSLMAPRPVLAADFALIARNIAGVWRSAAIDNYLPGVNERQGLTHDFTGGTFTINWNGDTTVPINYNASASDLLIAMQGLSSLEPGDINVTGGPLGASVEFEFKGRYAATDVPLIVVTNSMTGGTGVEIGTTVVAVPANTTAENAVAVVEVDASGNSSDDVDAELLTYLHSLVQQNFIINILKPSYTTVDVTWSGHKTKQADAADVRTRGNAAVTAYLASSNWGTPTWPIDARGWENQTRLRGQELYVVLNNVQGLEYVDTLVFSVDSGGVQDASDKNLLGTFPLTRPGDIEGSVV